MPIRGCGRFVAAAVSTRRAFLLGSTGLMELGVDVPRRLRRHPRHALELLLRRREERLRGAEVPDQRAPSSGTDAGQGVEDRLAGRGLNRATDTDFRGTMTWRVRLARGVYRFGSDARRLPGRLRVR